MPPEGYQRIWRRERLEDIREIHALVDYDNVKAGVSRETQPKESHASLDRLLSYLDRKLEQLGFMPRRTYVHLYGGWLNEDGRGSQDAQNLAPILHEFRTRKVAGGRISLDLKKRLEVLPDEQPGPELLGTRYKGRQKMVDAMLVLDTLRFCANATPALAVVVVSHDVDLLPGLLAASGGSGGPVPKYLLRLLRRSNDERKGACPQDLLLADVAEVHDAYV